MVNKNYSPDMVNSPVVPQTTPLPNLALSTTLSSSPFELASQVSTWSEWRRGYVSGTFNFESSIIIPDYWLRIVRVTATISPMHAKVPKISLSGLSADSGHPENPSGTPALSVGSPEHPAGTPLLNTDDESAHRHKWFSFLAAGVAFANQNGVGYGPGAVTWGASIGQSAANDGWTLAGDAHHHKFDHTHNDDHTHAVSITGSGAAISDYVDSADAAIVALYIDSALIQSGIHTVTEVDLTAALTGAQTPRLPAVGNHLLSFVSSKFGEVEVVLNWYVVSKPPEGF